VAFGNIGSVERQDFTVIGQDVNLVARLGTLAAQLGEPLLLSERVASRSPVGLRKVGEFPLKGFRDPQSVFARAS
jgi:adenylate cyclase